MRSHGQECEDDFATDTLTTALTDLPHCFEVFGRFPRGLPNSVPAAVTGDCGKFRVAKLGTLEIPSTGTATLVVRRVKDGWQAINSKSIRLKPAAAKE